MSVDRGTTKHVSILSASRGKPILATSSMKDRRLCFFNCCRRYSSTKASDPIRAASRGCWLRHSLAKWILWRYRRRLHHSRKGGWGGGILDFTKAYDGRVVIATVCFQVGDPFFEVCSYRHQGTWRSRLESENRSPFLAPPNWFPCDNLSERWRSRFRWGTYHGHGVSFRMLT